MTVVLRLLLLILPVIALLLFMRYRVNSDISEDEKALEIAKTRRWLTGIFAAFAVTAFALYALTDTGNPGTCYISPRTVDGKIVAGHYVAEDSAECIAERARKTPIQDELDKRLRENKQSPDGSTNPSGDNA